MRQALRTIASLTALILALPVAGMGQEARFSNPRVEIPGTDPRKPGHAHFNLGGAMGGAVVGAAAGFVVGYALSEDDKGDCVPVAVGCRRIDKAGLSTILGGAIGFAVGMRLGYKPAGPGPTPNLRFSARPSRKGVYAAVTARF